MNLRLALKKVYGQPSWTIATCDVRLSITRLGGHVAPVSFDRKRRKIAPYSIAPWHSEKLTANVQQVLRVARGDFFCMPFGGNERSYRGEQHPAHGETANRIWRLVDANRGCGTIEIQLRLETKSRPGYVDKFIRLVEGHNVVYSRHEICAAAGPMCYAHHAMLKCPKTPSGGLISTSRIMYGQVLPQPLESPENRGYSILKPGAKFRSLSSVPTLASERVDISRYPARRGFDDLVQMMNDPSSDIAWSAVSFPEQRYAWFALKDPRILTGTVLWFSNGGRHYSPWNGRHTNVLGVEDATAYFNFGLKESASANPISKLGFKTALELAPKEPLTVSYISGIALTSPRFDFVQSIERCGNGIRLTSRAGGHTDVPVDLSFLK